MSFFITKTSGEKELFSLRKFRRSLKKSGADAKSIDKIISDIIDMQPKSTQEIHDYTISQLTKKNRPIAARYNLKRALMELGPAGYPFEKYIAALLTAMGYKTILNQFIDGACVRHEVDVLASRNKSHYMVECKFHNLVGLKTDIKVALYIHARFLDIEKAWKKSKKKQQQFYQAWIISNTQFTSEAIQYAHCVDMRLTGWSYPAGESLAEMIDAHGLYPITALTSLNRRQKNLLIEDGLILCRDAASYKSSFKKYGLKPQEIAQLLEEARAVCSIE